jgi:hypothetical protein
MTRLMEEGTPHHHAHKRRTLWDRTVGLRARIKWPGWGFIILGTITWVPDWKSRLDFWLDIARSTSGGLIAMGARIFASPFFSPTLIVIGLVYLGLVGEPRRGVQRHPWWPYVGWIAFGLCVTAIFVTGVVGYVQISIQKQVGFQIDALQNKLLGSPIFWHLPEYNKTLLGQALDKIDEKDRFDVPAKCLVSSAGSQTYLSDIYAVLAEHHWKLTANCLFANLKPDLLGVWISVAKEIKKTEDLPLHAKTLAELLDAAEIKFQYGNDDIPKDQFFLVIGYGPDPGR